MARKTLPLDNTQIKNAKPKEKEYKLFDGGGLYILIKPNGSKGWRLKYLFEGKENRLSLGVYPLVGLADARIKRDEFKKMVASGINPSDMRKENKAQIQIELAEESNSFENVANEFLEKQKLRIGEKTHEKKVGRLKNHVFGPIGAKKIDDVTIH